MRRGRRAGGKKSRMAPRPIPLVPGAPGIVPAARSTAPVSLLVSTFLSVSTLFLVPAKAAGQDALDRAAGLEVVDEPLGRALLLLQQATGISLVFSPDLLPPDILVSCSCSRSTVAEALERILAGTGLDFVSRGGLVTIVPGGGGPSGDEPGIVVGQVLDAEDGTPIVNAFVQWRDGQGSLSRRNGAFLIRGVPAGSYRLRVTALGWRQESRNLAVVPPGDTARVSIRLEKDVIPLPEIRIEPGTFGLLEDVSPGTARTLTRQEIQTMPQLGEDVFRAMKRLPGVASGDISAQLHVRGGTHRETLVRLDGMELYEPYHLRDWEGALGIVDINVLGGVELLSGGFGVQHGDKTAAVFDMTSRRPEGKATTTLGLSISNVTAMSRGLFDDGRGAWLFSARRGFLDFIMDLANEGGRLSPKYHDVFGQVSYELGTSHRVSGHFLLAGDGLLLKDADVADVDAVDFTSDWDSRYGWVTWEAFGRSRFSATTVGWIGELGRRREGILEEDADTPFRISVSDRRDLTFAGLRTDLSFQLHERAVVNVGGSATESTSKYDYLHQTWSSFVTEENTRGVRVDTLDLAPEPDGRELSGYLALRTRPAAGLTAEVGIRYDEISHTRDRDLAPRFLAGYEISPRTNVRASLGRYSQSQGLHELKVGDGQTRYHPSERANQVALGLDHRFPGGVGMRVEAYWRTVSRPRPRFINAEQQLQIFPEAAGDRIRIDPTRGRAGGVELMVERKSGTRWAWAASYVLALAEDRVEGSWVPRRFDQRHTVAMETAFQPDPRWNLSMGWRFHSGRPATSWSWDVVSLDDGWNIWTQDFGPLRALRLPAYHRLDLRLTRRISLRKGTLQAYLDVINVYNRTNLGSWDYSGTYEGGRLTVQRLNGQELLPFLTTFGLKFEF